MMQSKIYNPGLLLAFGLLICASVFLLAIATPTTTEGTCSAAGGTCMDERFEYDAKDIPPSVQSLQVGFLTCQYTQSKSAGKDLHPTMENRIKTLIHWIQSGKFEGAKPKRVWCEHGDACDKTEDTGKYYLLMKEETEDWNGYQCLGRDATPKEAEKKFSLKDWKKHLQESKETAEEYEFRNTKAFKERFRSGGENGLYYLSTENSLKKSCTDVVFVTHPFRVFGEKSDEYRVAYVFRTENAKCPELYPVAKGHVRPKYSYEIRYAWFDGYHTHEHIVFAIPGTKAPCEKSGTCDKLQVVRKFLDQDTDLKPRAQVTPDWVTEFKPRQKIEDETCKKTNTKYCLPSATTFRTVSAGYIGPITKLK